MAWKEPRDWEGITGHGTDADKLGDTPMTAQPGVYDLNDEWSGPLRETMPAKAAATGQIFRGNGANDISTMNLGGANTVLRVVSQTAGTIEYASQADAIDQIYLTSAQHDLLQSDSNRSLVRLPFDSSGAKYLTSNGPGQSLTWESKEHFE